MGSSKKDATKSSSSAGHRGRDGRRRSRKGRSGPLRVDSQLAAPGPELLAQMEKSLADTDFVVFDLETTGGNPERNGITEIFAIKFKNGEATETFGTLVNPEIPIPPIVRRMTGINNAMVKDAPLIGEVMPDFLQFVGRAVLVSHNTIGDIKFLRHFSREAAGVTFENFYLCTHLLVEKMCPETPDKSLKGLAKYFGLAGGEFHRAEADTHVTLDLFRVLLDRLKERNVQRLVDAVRLQGDLESALRLGWGVPAEKLENIPSQPGVWRLFDHDRQLLFLSSSTGLDRDVLRLKSFDQLPKPLVRLILKSADLDVTPTPHLLAAILAECEEIKGQRLGIAPSQWHQRVPQLLFGAAHPEGLRLAIGPLESGTQFAYGPIRDRRLADTFLEQLGEALGGRMTRKGLILPQDAESTLLSFLTGDTEREKAELEARRRSIKLWFQPKERRALVTRLDLLTRLGDAKRPAKLENMLHRCGVIVVPRDGESSFDLYPIVHGLPLPPRDISGSVDAVRTALQNPDLLQILREGAKSPPPVPLSPAQADLANAILWWGQTVRGESRLIPLADLESMAAGKSR